MHNFKKALLPLMATAVIFGCSNDQQDLSDTTAFQNKQNGVTPNGLPTARFQPSQSVLPFPSDLLFAGTTDASLNIPGKVNTGVATAPAASALSDPQVALNTMDGFSTTSPMFFTTNVAVDTTTLQAGIHVYTPDASVNNAGAGIVGGVQQSTKTITNIGGKLVYGIDYVASATADGLTVAVVPLRPLTPNSTYYVVVTNDLKATSGLPIGADTEYVIAKSTAPVITQADGSACDFSNTATCTTIALSLLTEVATAISFEQVRLQTNTHETAAVTFDGTATGSAKINLTRDKIALGFSFSTQNVGAALLQAKGIATNQLAATTATGASITVTSAAGVNPVNSVGIDIDGAGPTPSQSYADIYAATLNNIPQFLDPANPTTAFWKADPTAWRDLTALGGSAAVKAGCDAAFPDPVPASENLVPCNGYRPLKAGDVSIPMLVAVPKVATVNAVRTALTLGNCPANLPVTIYQHGITTSRGTLMAIADNLALQCQVVVAIDMAQHGIAASDTTFAALRAQHAGLYASVPERLVGDATSGAGFINLANLANSRDTLRQSITDLHSLYTAVAPAAATGGAVTTTALTNAKIGVNIDQTKVSFVGMSLGGIVGMPFIAQQQGIQAAVLNVTGGGIAKILDGSNSFEPQITAGLSAAAGITKPSSAYETFLVAAQTMIDSADAINMFNQIVKPNSTGTTAGTTARAILMQEVAGTSTNLPDQTVPNNVFGLPATSDVGKAFATIYSKAGSLSPATYNPANTTPGLLSGTDPIARGTAFVGIASALATATANNDATTLAALGPLAANPNNIRALDTTGNGLVDANAALNNAFLGMNLQQMSETGGAASLALVRYSEGYHGSLLDPSSNTLASANVTTAMQLQMAGFIASVNAGGVGAAAVPGTANNVPAGVINAP